MTAPAAWISPGSGSAIGRPAAQPVDQVLLQVTKRLPGRVPVMPGPGAVGGQPPRGGALVHGQVDQVAQFGLLRRVRHPDQRLHPPVEVAVHQVCGTDPDLAGVVHTVAERVDPRVLEEAAEHAADPDVVRQARYAGAQRADAAHPHVHRYTGHRGPVQRVDDRLVDDRVALELDAGRVAVGVLGDLPFDAFQQARAQPLGGDEEPPVGNLAAEPGEVVEQVGRVLPDSALGGEQAEVFVEPGGRRIVVPGADVAVAAQRAVGFLPDHQRHLAVGLQAYDPVHHVAAGFLQLARPADVGPLVEPGLELHDDHDLLTGLGG